MPVSWLKKKSSSSGLGTKRRLAKRSSSVPHLFNYVPPKNNTVAPTGLPNAEHPPLPTSPLSATFPSPTSAEFNSNDKGDSFYHGIFSEKNHFLATFDGSIPDLPRSPRSQRAAKPSPENATIEREEAAADNKLLVTAPHETSPAVGVTTCPPGPDQQQEMDASKTAHSTTIVPPTYPDMEQIASSTQKSTTIQKENPFVSEPTNVNKSRPFALKLLSISQDLRLPTPVWSSSKTQDTQAKIEPNSRLVPKRANASKDLVSTTQTQLHVNKNYSHQTESSSSTPPSNDAGPAMAVRPSQADAVKPYTLSSPKQTNEPAFKTPSKQSIDHNTFSESPSPNSVTYSPLSDTQLESIRIVTMVGTHATAIEETS